VKVVYKNTGEPVVNDIWREVWCYVGKHYTTPGKIELVREIIDAGGGELYICSDCISSGAADKEIKKHGIK